MSEFLSNVKNSFYLTSAEVSNFLRKYKFLSNFNIFYAILRIYLEIFFEITHWISPGPVYSGANNFYFENLEFFQR